MGRRWLPLNALRAFEAVGRNLSVTAAAADLMVSQSAVSRHIIALESLLEIQLFERRPQGLVLTPAGALLLPVVINSLDQLSLALEQIIGTNKPRRSRRCLRVHLPATFAHQLAVPILRDFRRDYPDLSLEIESGSGPREERNRSPSLAVIYSEPQISDHIHDLLWMVRLTVFTHPSLARMPGQDLASFLARQELLHVQLENRSRYYLWDLFARQQNLENFESNRGLVFDTAQLAVQYALSGDGVALVDPRLFLEEIYSGQLVQPFDVHLDVGYGYYLSIHPDDLKDAGIVSFRSWLIRRFSAPKPIFPLLHKPQPFWEKTDASPASALP